MLRSSSHFDQSEWSLLLPGQSGKQTETEGQTERAHTHRYAIFADFFKGNVESV